jgi:hypothetical protein
MGIIASSCGDKASLIEIDSRTEDGFQDIVLTHRSE